MATIDLAVSCFNAGDFARSSALFTDSYWRREIGELAVKADSFARQVTGPVVPPSEQMEHRASLSDARLLTDGRIAGVFRWDQRQLDEGQLVAFLEVDGRWLFDEVIFIDEAELYRLPVATPEVASPAATPDPATPATS